MKNKLIKAVSVMGVAMLGVGLVAIGMKAGENKVYKNIIDISEEGFNVLSVCDKRTGRMYEVVAECIGD